MRGLAQVARRPVQVYLVGGATAVLEGWRDATIDVDLRLSGADADAVLRAIPAIKEQLSLNVELASPADFIPIKPGWENRSVRPGAGQGRTWARDRSEGCRRAASRGVIRHLTLGGVCLLVS
jgi:hypothetical protein